MAVKSNARAWWAMHSPNYPFQVESEKVIRPSTVEAELKCDDLISAASKAGGRVWGFKTEEERDLFIKTYGGTIVEQKT